MEANLQAYEKDMIRELRQAGVLVSDTQSVVGGLGFLFPGHGTHSSTMFDTYLKGSSSAGKLIEMADEVVNERCGYRLTDAVRGTFSNRASLCDSAGDLHRRFRWGSDGGGVLAASQSSRGAQSW